MKNKIKYIKILWILILLIVINIVISTNVKAETYTYNSATNTLPADFEAKYPGYKALIENIIKLHPTWTINLYQTGLDWDAVINNEYTGHWYSPKNLVPANSTAYSGDWVCTICGTTTYDSGNWVCASRHAISYMMDPRNGLTDENIFQFQDLSSSVADRVAIEAMVKGTFIDTVECIDAIFTGATTYNVSPYHLVARIIQEQGRNGSTLGLGLIADDGVTYHNIFNVGAYGNGSAEVIANGLATAKSKGWTSIPLAIIGGTEFVAKNYIAIGQNTLYYQKFNVVYTNSLYNHQYMQNLLAAQNEGRIMRSSYSSYGILESNYMFNVPLYENMPVEAIQKPSQEYTYEGEIGEIAYINADGGLALRDAPGLSSNRICYIEGQTQILITERATVKIDGYYWDKVTTPKGTGYMAREETDGSKTFLVVIQNNNPTVPTEPTNPDEPILIQEDIKVTPAMTIQDISGGTLEGNVFGTGAIVKTATYKYTIVMLGDINGDGLITAADYVKVKNNIMGTTTLSGAYKNAADVNKDGYITAADYVKIKNHIMKVSQISL